MATAEPRLMTTPGDYLLSRDSREATRLNEQHVAWTKNIGYLINPHIEASLPPDARIADLACGTGAWALHAASLYPKARLDAIDISPMQFPPQEIRPANVAFSTHDVRQPFDAKHHAQFDLVQIRAIVAGMNEDDWNSVITNVIQILKPGGALQWCEADLTRATVVRGSETYTRYKYFPELLEKWEMTLGQRDLSGPRRLPKLIKDAGAVEVEVDVVSSDRLPELRPAVALNYTTAILGWAASTDASESFHGILESIKQEIAAGAYVRVDNFIIIARRAL